MAVQPRDVALAPLVPSGREAMATGHFLVDEKSGSPCLLKRGIHIGSSNRSDLQIKVPAFPMHASIIVTGLQAILTCYGDTRVNDLPVSLNSNILLEHNDVISICDNRLRYAYTSNGPKQPKQPKPRAMPPDPHQQWIRNACSSNDSAISSKLDIKTVSVQLKAAMQFTAIRATKSTLVTLYAEIFGIDEQNKSEMATLDELVTRVLELAPIKKETFINGAYTHEFYRCTPENDSSSTVKPENIVKPEKIVKKIPKEEKVGRAENGVKDEKAAKLVKKGEKEVKSEKAVTKNMWVLDHIEIEVAKEEDSKKRKRSLNQEKNDKPKQEKNDKLKQEKNDKPKQEKNDKPKQEKNDKPKQEKNNTPKHGKKKPARAQTQQEEEITPTRALQFPQEWEPLTPKHYKKK